MRSTFTSYSIQQGPLDDFSTDPHPTKFFGWKHETFSLNTDATHFGYVYRGESTLTCSSGKFQLRAGMYFSVPKELSIEGGSGILISRLKDHGFFQIGGPVEDQGRLRYIDGCTDSLLISPVLMGDPCLNLLHLPPGTRQSQHTHPSLRLGLILQGTGTCVTPEANISLIPGQAFAIKTGGQHSFHTDKDALRVLAYHPESDFGPTHENHPMVNKTILSGPN